ncbi:thioredoxin domain-containing protein [Halovibrio sp. HP20-50]|uniref:thioredoxin domain-containing protein n=1 Tax=Halovibrio sp. HP20-59 TaxID=3080275 RepID=UPI00294B6E1F|nr:thioredoxin domain-containing protein [Halovibrio sp. HP20-59]MEA2117055.1 thioredoxin domain-containing protein [Halovibrio sp. HP20-59]
MKKAHSKKPARKPSASVHPAKKLKTLAKKLLIVLAFLAVPIAWLIVNDHTSRTESNLSVIGSGTPVAVQVHDHGCPLCQRLKANAEEALDQMASPPAWRIMDINTRKGADFASQYNVGHVTILLFDARGNRQETIEGVTSANSLRDSFEKMMATQR